MAHAYNNLAGNAFHQQTQKSIIGKSTYRGGIVKTPADAATKAEACYYCHGTKLEVTGRVTRDTAAAGELEFPVIKGWPNQGVGRINLDGSMGSCSACHTRHAFSIEMARKPYTCKECHIGPDVPAFKVYASSKHGNIFAAMEKSWDFSAVPWTIGKDFSAPTCAACHISLLVNSDDEIISERTHQMNNRLPWRILGLIYAHPHPIEPDTTMIRNKKGEPLPTDFDGGFAGQYLIDAKEQNLRRQAMQAACLNCHSTSWVEGHWARFENTINVTNAETLTGANIIKSLQQFSRESFDGSYKPFNEAINKKWYKTWLFYANTIRFASAMGGGGDYTVFAEGRYQMSQNLQELSEWLKLNRKLFPKEEEEYAH
jgi:cytochrome c553